MMMMCRDRLIVTRAYLSIVGTFDPRWWARIGWHLLENVVVAVCVGRRWLYQRKRCMSVVGRCRLEGRAGTSLGPGESGHPVVSGACVWLFWLAMWRGRA